MKSQLHCSIALMVAPIAVSPAQRCDMELRLRHNSARCSCVLLDHDLIEVTNHPSLPHRAEPRLTAKSGEGRLNLTCAWYVRCGAMKLKAFGSCGLVHCGDPMKMLSQYASAAGVPCRQLVLLCRRFSLQAEHSGIGSQRQRYEILMVSSCLTTSVAGAADIPGRAETSRS